ncbi:MAG: glutamyl-tRNA reductase, partial [Candidatus Hydrothermarchaeaceae archaeon]
VDVVYHEVMDYLMDKGISRMKRHLPKHELPPEKLLEHMIEMSKNFHDVIEVDLHSAALHHLLRLTSGLESMIVGEDQILGQVRDAYQLAYGANTVGPFFKSVFSKAIHVGGRVRTETRINEGVVSIGSAAVELAKSILGSLEGKTILLVGAGEMGKLVAKSLKDLDLNILVANRTPARSVELAKELKGKIVRFDEIIEGIKNSDLVITATGAPHAIITEEMVRGAVEGRKKKLVVIDLGVPRNVEDKAGRLRNVKLANIDDLRGIAEKNRRLREMEAVKVESIIEEELSLLEKQIYHIDVESIVKAIFGEAERIRRGELEKAIKMLGDGVEEKEKEVLDDLTRVIINRTMSPIAGKIREAAEKGDALAIKIAEKWFMKEG